MTDLLILRHGPTAWNTEGLIQGRTGHSPVAGR